MPEMPDMQNERTLSVWLDSGHVQRFCMSHVFCGSYVLFMRPIGTFFQKTNLKWDPMILFTHLKNYFITIFSVFNNKQYLNRP